MPQETILAILTTFDTYNTKTIFFFSGGPSCNNAAGPVWPRTARPKSPLHEAPPPPPLKRTYADMMRGHCVATNSGGRDPATNTNNEQHGDPVSPPGSSFASLVLAYRAKVEAKQASVLARTWADMGYSLFLSLLTPPPSDDWPPSPISPLVLPPPSRPNDHIRRQPLEPSRGRDSLPRDSRSRPTVAYPATPSSFLFRNRADDGAPTAAFPGTPSWIPFRNRAEEDEESEDEEEHEEGEEDYLLTGLADLLNSDVDTTDPRLEEIDRNLERSWLSGSWPD
ncbi:hypothetical protein F5Y17DRAFT_461022 [Xylariaceae sp. FL0594]|nr:hypothetical protein F5Y17DRAFT_461022 [Xylariaceae sp. FL0594]